MISSMVGIYPHTAITVSVPEQKRFVSLKNNLLEIPTSRIIRNGIKKGQKK